MWGCSHKFPFPLGHSICLASVDSSPLAKKPERYGSIELPVIEFGPNTLRINLFLLVKKTRDTVAYKFFLWHLQWQPLDGKSQS